MTSAIVVARIGLAAILALAGVAKLADRKGSAQAAREFGLGRLASAAAGLVPILELGLAAALVPAWSARVAAAGVVVLLSSFTVAMAVALARGRRPDCHCFGRLHRSHAGLAGLTRNAGLLAVAAVVASRPAASAGWPELAVSGAIALVTVQAIAGYALLRRYGRALRRVEELEAGIERPAALVVGDPAPDFALARLDGSEATLRGLLQPARSLLLVFVNPLCGPCHALLPALARLDERVALVFVSEGDGDANAAFTEYGEVVLEREREVAALYGVVATPSAILIGPHGQVERPLTAGAGACASLVAEAPAREEPEVSTRERARTAVGVAGGLALWTAAAAGAARASSAAPLNDPQVAMIDAVLRAAGPGLRAASERSLKAMRAQASLRRGKQKRAKEAAARRALAAERTQVLALRSQLAELALQPSPPTAHNARVSALLGLDMLAQSLQTRMRAIGAAAKVAGPLIEQADRLLVRALDSITASAELLARG